MSRFLDAIRISFGWGLAFDGCRREAAGSDHHGLPGAVVRLAGTGLLNRLGPDRAIVPLALDRDEHALAHRFDVGALVSGVRNWRKADITEIMARQPSKFVSCSERRQSRVLANWWSAMDPRTTEANKLEFTRSRARQAVPIVV